MNKQRKRRNLKSLFVKNHLILALLLTALPLPGFAADPVSVSKTAQPLTKIPRFSVDYMDRSVDPGTDFYQYANGTWLKNNPVPADKSWWGGFMELRERNWQLLHDILDATATDKSAPAKSPRRLVGDFYISATDTNRLEKLALTPLIPDFKRIAAIKSSEDLLRLLAEFNLSGIEGGMFSLWASPDDKDTTAYTLYLAQGGLGMPDRDYYLTERFAKDKAAYLAHVTRMFQLTGEKEPEARAHATTVVELETALAKASKPRAELRDPVANYHKFAVSELPAKYPSLPLQKFLTASQLGKLSTCIVRQPEFFDALDKLVKDRPVDDWKVYLRWHVLHQAAAYLNADFENESFAFYGTTLSGKLVQEPRWQRATKVIDTHIGEALGQIYVEKYFPPAARARMNELIGNLKVVFRDRLQKLEWMSETTRAKAVVKFDHFTQKIGYPDKFRDYSAVKIRPDDLLGNVRRATAFETHRQYSRIGQAVDRTEWDMTPPTVNAYYNGSFNEIVFPAGILQPPFFDMEADDAVNYGGIGLVIGHEITHGYDDEGRQYDGDGNLKDWWTEADAKEFNARAQRIVEQFNNFEALPGLHVNGKLTLGENLADLGGANIAYEALQRALAKDPSKRKLIDGFTPEQRYFISFAQIWRENNREAALRQSITTNPHSPGRFRVLGPVSNMPEFYKAFGIKAGAPMWRAPELRTRVW